MAFTTADADALRAAMATGAMKVRYADGREVTYRTLAEMERILRTIDAVVASPAAEPRSRSSVVGF